MMRAKEKAYTMSFICLKINKFIFNIFKKIHLPLKRKWIFCLKISSENKVEKMFKKTKKLLILEKTKVRVKISLSLLLKNKTLLLNMR